MSMASNIMKMKSMKLIDIENIVYHPLVPNKYLEDEIPKYGQFVLKYDNKNDAQNELFLVGFIQELYQKVYQPILYRVLSGHNFFQTYYDKYINDTIKIATKNDFLDHSSFDVISLSIESSFLKYYQDFYDNLEFLPYERFLAYVKHQYKHFSVLLKSRVHDIDSIDYYDNTIEMSLYNFLKNNRKPICKEIRRIIERDFKYIGVYDLVIREVVKSFEFDDIFIDNNYLLLRHDIFLFFTKDTSSFNATINVLNEWNNEINELINNYKDGDKIPKHAIFVLADKIRMYILSSQRKTEDKFKTALTFVETLINNIKNDDIKDFYIHQSDIINFIEIKNFLWYELEHFKKIYSNRVNFTLKDGLVEALNNKMNDSNGNCMLYPHFVRQCYSQDLGSINIVKEE